MKSRGPGDETTIESPSKFMMMSSQGMGGGSIFKTPNKESLMRAPQYDFGSPDPLDDQALKMSHFSSQNQGEQEKLMVDIFRQQLELERQLEKAKIDLTLRTDFNLIDAFRIFD
jgi:hypothetical protein